MTACKVNILIDRYALKLGIKRVKISKGFMKYLETKMDKHLEKMSRVERVR